MWKPGLPMEVALTVGMVLSTLQVHLPGPKWGELGVQD